VVQRNLKSGIASLGTQVATVHRRQPLARDETQPEKRRQARVSGILCGALKDLELGLLEHVGGVNPALKPTIQSEPNHSLQLVAMAGKQLGKRLRVAASGAT
jgi:hypothetical protein